MEIPEGNGSGFDTIDEFTTMAVYAITGMCETEMSALLAYLSEHAPQQFQLGLAEMAGTVFERHDHAGVDLDEVDPEDYI